MGAEEDVGGRGRKEEEKMKKMKKKKKICIEKLSKKFGLDRVELQVVVQEFIAAGYVQEATGHLVHSTEAQEEEEGGVGKEEEVKEAAEEKRELGMELVEEKEGKKERISQPSRKRGRRFGGEAGGSGGGREGARAKRGDVGSGAEASASNSTPTSAVASSKKLKTIQRGPGSASEANRNAKLIAVACWNVAACVPSQLAPDWWTSQQTAAAVAEILKATGSVALALQEAPPFLESLLRPDYKLVELATSHAPGRVMLFVQSGVPVSNVRKVGPAVVARLTVHGVDVDVASIHLAPFKRGVASRDLQIREVYKIVARPAVVLGDTNMRAKEGTYPGWEDAWISLKRNRSTRFSWDGHKNWYHGAEDFRFCCRFDRVFVANGKEAVLKPESFKLIGNEPILGVPHNYLSDHFGVVAKLALETVRY